MDEQEIRTKAKELIELKREIKLRNLLDSVVISLK